MYLKDVPLVEFMYLVLVKRTLVESYRRRLRSLLLCMCYVFRALINSLVQCWNDYRHNYVNAAQITMMVLIKSKQLRVCVNVVQLSYHDDVLHKTEHIWGFNATGRFGSSLQIWNCKNGTCFCRGNVDFVSVKLPAVWFCSWRNLKSILCSCFKSEVNCLCKGYWFAAQICVCSCKRALTLQRQHFAGESSLYCCTGVTYFES